MNMAGRKNLNKNAISAFEEYGVQHRQPPKVDIVSMSGPPHKPVFVAVARLGETEICNEKGNSKHEARIKAAERALQLLSVQNASGAGSSGCSEVAETLPVESSEEVISNPIPYKDPVSALMEYGQFAKQEVCFDLISQDGPPHMPIFTMAVKLGSQVYPSVKGGSAKESKKLAACVALSKLKKEGALQALFPDTKSSAIPVGKVKTKSTLGIPGKNPVSVLNEYAQKSSIKLRFESSQTGPPHKPVFNVYAVLGEETFPVVSAASKKEGNVQAAEAVLKALAERGQYLMPKAVTTQSNTTNSVMPVAVNHYDKVAMAAGRKVDELLLQTPESLVGRKVTSAIVMFDRETGVYRVVSVGSGNRCVKGSHITDDGMVLNDSHAEVLARRGFKRFLYYLLRTKDLPIIEKSRQRKWRFKEGISFHLYISTAPCGDGALFTHSDRGAAGTCCSGSEHRPVFSNLKTQGLLRAKQENGEGTIPVEPEFVTQTYDGIQQGGRLRVMSCSDKICQWNVLGLQGALLSTVYEPVYLQSIVLGNLYNAGHLARAVCCRIDHSTTPLQSQLPCGYHVNHPDLGVTSHQDTTRVVEKARPLSINWSFGDKEPEITDGTIGKTTKTVARSVGASRLCKKSILSLYRDTIDNTIDINFSYRQVKLQSDCDHYNQAKMALHKRLHEQNFGSWVSMPREVDRFQLN
ncbi:double-stranded RNA-specific adenosine deaminase-like isoform X2 [Ruditapes philippinarum]|nr:double-stranded RNA-specific adenosine deaminase-like isoform X2 [Ruditapes philippinarum]